MLMACLGKLVKEAHGLLESLRNMASVIPDSKRFHYHISHYM